MENQELIRQNPWLAAKNGTEYLNLWLARRPNANADEQSILQDLANQTPENKPSDLSELTIKLKETEAKLWVMQVKYLEGTSFTEILTPVLQKVYWLGYRNGYLAVEENRIDQQNVEAVPDGFQDKSIDVYRKGFKDGKSLWYLVWD